MANKLRLIAFFLIVFVTIGKAQVEYNKADSISLSFYNTAQWKKLISFGDEAIANGNDFSFLRLRVAYAHFVRQNYSGALVQYDHILLKDSHNQIALYFAYLCNINLNRPEDAGYLVAKLDTNVIENEKIKSFKLLSLGTESGIKFTDVYDRGNSSYNRAFIKLRLNYKLNLETSYSYYNQPIREDNIGQPGYFVKLTYSPFRKINFIGTYHYMRSILRTNIFQNNAALLGLRFADSKSDLQGDFILSQIGDEKTRQYNLKFTRYLTGNLNLYSISRFSILDVSNEKNIVFYQLIGFKPIRNFWIESSVTLGNQYNYAEADALYIYNGFDKTKFKTAANCYFMLNRHLILSLNYTFEHKTDNIFRFNFLQHSLNGGITWNF